MALSLLEDLGLDEKNRLALDRMKCLEIDRVKSSGVRESEIV